MQPAETADLIVDSEFAAPNIRAVAAELLSHRILLRDIRRIWLNPVLHEMIDDALRGRLHPAVAERTVPSKLKATKIPDDDEFSRK